MNSAHGNRGGSGECTAIGVKQRNHVGSRRDVFPHKCLGHIRSTRVVVDTDCDGAHPVAGQQRNAAARHAGNVALAQDGTGRQAKLLRQAQGQVEGQLKKT